MLVIEIYHMKIKIIYNLTLFYINLIYKIFNFSYFIKKTNDKDYIYTIVSLDIDFFCYYTRLDIAPSFKLDFEFNRCCISIFNV